MACSITAAPAEVWVFMISNSSSVNLPGLFRMASETWILPMSCSGAEFTTSYMNSSVSWSR